MITKEQPLSIHISYRQFIGGTVRVSSNSNGVSDLKHRKFGVITLLLFGIVIALTGIVCADQVVNATPEIQSLSTVTTADVVGLAMETDAGVWTLTNDPLVLYSVNNQTPGLPIPLAPITVMQFNVWQAELQSAGGSIQGYNLGGSMFQPTQYNVPESLLNTSVPGEAFTWSQALQGLGTVTTIGIHTGSLDPGQVQYTTAYDANIVAQGGHTVLTKSMNLDTRNKVISQSNLIAQTGLTYIATYDGGNVVGSENLMLDGAGNTTRASDRILCPFVPQKEGNVIPAYCNIVQVGSKYDLTVGSVTTSANERFVGSDAANPVDLNYAINVKPYGTSQGQILASGSTMAYIKAHIQESRDYSYVGVPVGNGLSIMLESKPQKAEDLTYSETSSAQGTITSFNKVIAYQSGRLLLP